MCLCLTLTIFISIQVVWNSFYAIFRSILKEMLYPVSKECLSNSAIGCNLVLWFIVGNIFMHDSMRRASTRLSSARTHTRGTLDLYVYLFPWSFDTVDFSTEPYGWDCTAANVLWIWLPYGRSTSLFLCGITAKNLTEKRYGQLQI